MSLARAEVGLANFLTLLCKSGETEIVYRFQNYWLDEQKTFEGQSYEWLPFSVGSIGASSEGDATNAAIALPNNVLALQVINGSDGLRNQQAIIVSAYVDAETDAILSGGLTRNLFTIDSSTVREAQIDIELQSVVNALLDTFPRSRITEANCGRLPQNSQIRFA